MVPRQSHWLRWKVMEFSDFYVPDSLLFALKRKKTHKIETALNEKQQNYTHKK